MSNAIAKPGGGEFELVPVGVYVARCFRVLFIGTQPKVYNGVESGSAQKIIVTWELLNDGIRREDGSAFTISLEYTLSLSKRAKLAQHLEAWFGVDVNEKYKDGFDCQELIDKYCRMQIAHKTSAKGNNYAVITSLMGMMPSEAKPAGINKTIFFDIVEPDMEVFNGLSDYYREQIENAEEWQTNSSAPAAAPVAATADPNAVDPTTGKPLDDLSEIPF